MATYTLIEINGDFLEDMLYPYFGAVLGDVVRNPSNAKLYLDNHLLDRAVRVVHVSMWPYEGQHTKERLEKIRTALGLLNSMVMSGENHSETSRAALRDAFETLAKLEHA